MNPDFQSGLCALAEQFPVGIVALHNRREVTVISAVERENAPEYDKGKMLDRVGSAYVSRALWSGDKPTTYIAVREPSGRTNGILPQNLKYKPGPAAYTQRELDDLVQSAKTRAYNEGYREGYRDGRHRTAVKFQDLAREMGA